jgi:HPt (histidine-containing phosphotransfer) domain-containing protein
MVDSNNDGMNEVSLDYAVLRDLAELDEPGTPSIVDELIGLFLQITPTQIAGLEAALGAKDLKALKAVAHSLKSSSGNLGARKLSQIAQNIENLSDLANAAELVSALKVECGIVEGLLKSGKRAA